MIVDTTLVLVTILPCVKGNLDVRSIRDTAVLNKPEAMVGQIMTKVDAGTGKLTHQTTPVPGHPVERIRRVRAPPELTHHSAGAPSDAAVPGFSDPITSRTTVATSVPMAMLSRPIVKLPVASLMLPIM